MRNLILSGNNSTQLNSTQLNSTQLNSTQLNSTQLNATQRITLNFIFLLIPAILLIYYVYSLGIYFLICYFQISQILKFQKLENCIFIFKNAFYKKLILWRRLCLKQQKEFLLANQNYF